MKSASGWHPFDEIRADGEIPNTYRRRHTPKTISVSYLKQEMRTARKLEESKDRKARNKRRRNALLTRLAVRDGGMVCFYCKVELVFENCTLDHVIPKSKGGRDTFDNYVLACDPCNHDKGDRIIQPREVIPLLSKNPSTTEILDTWRVTNSEYRTRPSN